MPGPNKIYFPDPGHFPGSHLMNKKIAALDVSPEAQEHANSQQRRPSQCELGKET